MADDPRFVPFGAAAPHCAESVWVAPNATLIGAVRIGADSGVFFTAVLRADSASIEIGERTNLQDGVVLHADPGHPCRIGSDVSVGHRTVLHGCTIEDGCLVGMSATVLNGATVGAGSLVAAGAVVLEGARIPPGSLVAGVPGKVRRELTGSERLAIEANAALYVELGRRYRAG